MDSTTYQYQGSFVRPLDCFPFLHPNSIWRSYSVPSGYEGEYKCTVVGYRFTTLSMVHLVAVAVWLDPVADRNQLLALLTSLVGQLSHQNR